jgi:hypothetical protein
MTKMTSATVPSEMAKAAYTAQWAAVSAGPVVLSRMRPTCVTMVSVSFDGQSCCPSVGSSALPDAGETGDVVAMGAPYPAESGRHPCRVGAAGT